MKWWSLIKSYLRERSFYIITLSIFIVIYCGVYFVYDIELQAVFYATYLVLFILVIVACIDFYTYYRKYQELKLMKQNVLVFNNPSYKLGLFDKEYLDVVEEIKRLYYENDGITNQQFKDLEDYFTLWVHQIKLPISAIKLLLETEKVPDKKLLKSELLRINQYTDMVLAYLRMRSIDTDYVFEIYELDDLIRQAIRKFSTEFIRKKLQIQFDETHIKVLTDEKWLVFVLEQLLSNAIKYTNQGYVHIYGNDNTLYIEDTGIGIDASDLPRVFDKGFTGYNGRSDKKASGLGLYLCKNIIDKLSHRLELESQVDKGTKVILHLERKDLRVE